MCGFLGFYKKDGVNKEDIKNVKRSIKSISYRGPDASGINIVENLILSHCRLSIIDLDKRSNQPMIDGKNGNIIIFNGEIYNFEYLRKNLRKKRIEFLTNSDTEVLLKGYAFYGVNFINKLEGMFALAIYDKELNRLILSRDLSGEKPLYYYHNQGQFIFSSEIKSLLPLINQKLNIDEKELSYFLKNGHSSFNNTIIQDLKQIEPGHIIHFDQRLNKIKTLKNFNLRNFIINDENKRGNLVDDIYILLKNSIKHQLISDVPIGTLLSGGLDSSIITTITAKLNPDINAFSVRFPDGENSKDIEISRNLANNLGIKHQIIDAFKPSFHEIIALLENMDYPSGDPAIIPTYLLCKSVKRYCKVAIGGDGADELFGGYKHINRSIKLAKTRKLLGKNITTIFIKALHRFKLIEKNKFEKSILISEKKIPLFPSLLTNEDLNNYVNFDLILTSNNIGKWENIKKMHLELLIYDLQNFLPNNILFKSDRISMLSSLELRNPYLDFSIIKYMLNNYNLFIKNGYLNNKILLKKLALEKLSLNFFKNKKLGFLPPINKYFYEKIDREYIYEYISENNYLEFNNNFLFKKIKESSKSTRSAIQIFELLSLTAWLKNNYIYLNPIKV